MSSHLRIDIVVPMYNEAEVVQQFHRNLVQVMEKLPYAWRVIYVDDGSCDQTLGRLLELSDQDPHMVVVELSRNFGHQACLTAGLSLADADYVITMDGDGQHPAAILPEMIVYAEQGYDIILTQRVEKEDLGWFKRRTSSAFYKLINYLSSTKLKEGSADFRLMNRRALDALRSMPEYHRFLRGMIAWMGFRSVVLPFTPEKRIAGNSKYSLRKMLLLALDAIFSFSLIPLYFAVAIGILFLFLSVIEIIYVASFWLAGNSIELAPGWASLMFVILFSGGSILVTLGIIGVYVGYIFQEVKHRPVYLIRAIHNFSGL